MEKQDVHGAEPMSYIRNIMMKNGEDWQLMMLLCSNFLYLRAFRQD